MRAVEVVVPRKAQLANVRFGNLGQGTEALFVVGTAIGQPFLGIGRLDALGIHEGGGLGCLRRLFRFRPFATGGKNQRHGHRRRENKLIHETPLSALWRAVYSALLVAAARNGARLPTRCISIPSAYVFLSKPPGTSSSFPLKRRGDHR